MTRELKAEPRNRKRKRAFLAVAGYLILIVIAILSAIVAYEVHTNKLQALLFSRYAEDITWEVGKGESSSIVFPQEGPFDITLGYTLLPSFAKRLQDQSFVLSGQARQSPKAMFLQKNGIAIPYPQKTSPGLRILGRNGVEIFRTYVNTQRFASFESIPSQLLQLLLSRENQELFDFHRPFLNPAVEWDRFALACITYVREKFLGISGGFGSSTLATQLVKFRHSPQGMTRTPQEKLKQMLGASLWSYRQGPYTIPLRKEIVMDYLNEMPLGAAPGYGAINGLGAGMWSWFGKDLQQVVADFSLPENDYHSLQQKAKTLKEVLSLVIATQRPSFYLNGNLAPLEVRVNNYLQILETAGIISAALRQTAMESQLQFTKGAPFAPALSYVERKGTDAIRIMLLDLLKVETLYELDRLDLTVETTFDMVAQQKVNGVLNALYDQEFLADNGFLGPYLLSQGDPQRIIYSVALFESRQDYNASLLKADTLNRPLNINLGTKLELGSTAKLRTLCTYLIVIDEVAGELMGKNRSELLGRAAEVKDPFSAWVLQHLLAHPEVTREEVLAASLKRNYSASPSPGFFTGGGFHVFSNFKKEQDFQSFTVERGFRDSVNLVFIRLMKDVVDFYIAKLGYDVETLLSKTGNPQRLALLQEAADIESKEFLRRFYQIHSSKTYQQSFSLLAKSQKHPLRNWLILYLKENPDAPWEQVLEDANRSFEPGFDANALWKLYKSFQGKFYSLTDEAYLLGKHPLEVWVVSYLQENPHASWNEVLEASTKARTLASAWLFKSRFHKAQNIRLRSYLERKAFEEMHRTWRSLGYPFQSLVPSLATAIGSSADRPENLAELVGIILNDGMHKPSVTIKVLHFATETPYESHFSINPQTAKQVMSREVAHTLRSALRQVVLEGTGRRIKNVFADASGSPLDIGGKTGTGDNRMRTFRKGGELVSSKSINRTSTFVFYAGTFFGIVTAHVEGAQAGQYEFTSALAVQVLKSLKPALDGLMNCASQDHHEPDQPIMLADQ